VAITYDTADANKGTVTCSGNDDLAYGSPWEGPQADDLCIVPSDIYEFAGWYADRTAPGMQAFVYDVTLLTSANGVDTSGETPTLTLYARWHSDDVAITYRSADTTKGTVSCAGSSEPYGDAWTGPVAGDECIVPIDSSYVFVGWFTDPNNPSAVEYEYDETLLTSANGVETSESTPTLTLYARWAQELTLFYDANGGAAFPPLAPSTCFMSYPDTTCDVTVSTEGSGITPPTGWDYAGWNTSPDGTGYDVAPGSEVELTLAANPVTLYAKWTRTLTLPYDKGMAWGGYTDPTTCFVVYPVSSCNVVTAENGFYQPDSMRMHFVYWDTIDIDVAGGTIYYVGDPYTLTVDNDGQPLYPIFEWDKD
jgi:uncharacterized repeat protein (TIGR02543 family)